MLLTSVIFDTYSGRAPPGDSAHLAARIECQDFIALVPLCSPEIKVLQWVMITAYEHCQQH